MIEHHLDLDTGEGSMNTFVTHPEEGGPFPVVLFFMDAPGKREELHEMARRIGTAGYYVMLPNLYYRTDRDWQMVWDDPEGMKAMFRMAMTLDYNTLRIDTTALLAHAAADPVADDGNVGAVGYCMSGRFAFASAALFPDQIKATASYYATRLSGEQSPERFAPEVKAECYFAVAEHDEHITDEITREFAAHLDQAGVKSRFEWYPGTGHGFAFPHRPDYQPEGAERHYERLFDLFDRNLRGRS